MEINELLTPGSPYDSLVNQVKPLISKWNKSGLLEGIKNNYEKAGMAILLENQAKQLLKESSVTGTGTNGSNESWNGVALPLVRRVFGEIASKEFVSIQPMNLPSGLIFFLDFKYSNPGGPWKFQNTGSIFGGTGSFGTTPSADGGLYGSGRWGYSLNETASFVAYTTSSITTLAPFNYDSRYSALSASYSTLVISNMTASAMLNASQISIRSFVPATSGSSTSTILDYLPAFTTYNSATDKLTFVVSGSNLSGSTNNSTAIVVYYNVQPTSTSRGDFEDAAPNVSTTGLGQLISGSFAPGIPELEIKMQSIPIVAKTRKLKASWTPEFAQDLNAYHSIDAEAELTSVLSEYVSMEIDLEILDMLISAAPTTDVWSANINEFWNGNSFVAGSTSAIAYNQGTWFQTIGTKIQKISNIIHQLTMRGGANFVCCSPQVSTILESIPGYAADTDGNKMNYAMGVQKIGQVNNRFNVYKNPYMIENQMLIGFRGQQFLECGAVFAPYIPLIMTPLVYDPENFTPRRGVLTRYALKVVRPEFYGKLYVKGAELV